MGPNRDLGSPYSLGIADTSSSMPPKECLMKSSILLHPARVLAILAAFGAGAACAADPSGASTATTEPERQSASTETPQAPSDSSTMGGNMASASSSSMGSPDATQEKPAWLDNETRVNGIFVQD